MNTQTPDAGEHFMPDTALSVNIESAQPRRPVILKGPAVLALMRGETVWQTARKAERFMPGMLLWAKERWNHSFFPDAAFSQKADVFYRADYFDDPWGVDWEYAPDGTAIRQWLPASSMPRAASRLAVVITGMREFRSRQPSLWADMQRFTPYCEIALQKITTKNRGTGIDITRDQLMEPKEENQ